MIVRKNVKSVRPGVVEVVKDAIVAKKRRHQKLVEAISRKKPVKAQRSKG